MSKQTDFVPKAYGTMPDAVQYSGMSRSALYEAMKRGDLVAKKAGRRTLISFSALREYLDSLPAFEAAE